MKINIDFGYSLPITLVLIILKLIGVISWSWFIVFIPLIFTVGIIILELLALILYLVIFRIK